MIWMNISKGTILVPLFFLFSCSGEVSLSVTFPTERKAGWELVSDELYVNVVYDLWEYKSCLLVPVADMKTGHNLWIYDKNTGKRIWSGINDGRGPGETMSGLQNTYFADGVLTYYDDMKWSILRYQIDSILAGSFLYREERYDPPTWTMSVVESGDNRLFMKNVGYSSPDLHEVSRFELQDRAGHTLCQYDYSPVSDPELRFYEYMYTPYSASPDKSRLAIGTLHGTVLETYGIGQDSIAPIAVRVFEDPDIDVSSGGYDYNERTVLGFYDIYAFDDRILAAYDGEVNPYWNSGDRQTYTKIAVFDWEGNPLELIHTDYKIERLCYSETENTIYAAVMDRDGIMYLAKMEL